MRGGELDQQIELESLVETNKGGELLLSHVPVATVWAKVISERGQESFESARANARATIKVKMRFRADVETTWRIKWDGQYYEVFSVDRSLRRAGELWLMCRILGAK